MSNQSETMQMRENQCVAYMRKADEIREAQGVPTKEECVCLQRAATLRAEMVQLSLGEERLYQQQCFKEVNARMLTILKEIDPEQYELILQRANAPKSQKPSADNHSSDASDSKAGNQAARDLSVEKEESMDIIELIRNL